MDGDKKGPKKLFLVLGASVLVLFVIIGGYVLFMYDGTDSQIDPPASSNNNSEPAPSQVSGFSTPPDGWYAYQNVDLRLRFFYPDGWVVTEKKGSGSENMKNVQEVHVTSPDGSQLLYFTAELTGFGVEGGCDPSNPTGDGELVYSCVFVTQGEKDFARYRPNENSVERGEWLVAEENSEGLYVSWPSSSFTYLVKDPTELLVLDEIMGSVQRL